MANPRRAAQQVGYLTFTASRIARVTASNLALPSEWPMIRCEHVATGKWRRVTGQDLERDRQVGNDQVTVGAGDCTVGPLASFTAVIAMRTADPIAFCGLERYISSEEITMSTRTAKPDTSPLEAGYARLNDKIDALRRLVTLIGVGTAIVLLVALRSLL